MSTQGLYMPWSSDWSLYLNCICSVNRDITTRMVNSLVIETLRTNVCFLVLSKRWHQRLVASAFTAANLMRSTVTAHVMLHISTWQMGCNGKIVAKTVDKQACCYKALVYCHRAWPRDQQHLHLAYAAAGSRSLCLSNASVEGSRPLKSCKYQGPTGWASPLKRAALL